MSAKEFLDADKRGGLDHAEQKNHARRACYLYAGRDCLSVPGFVRMHPGNRQLTVDK